MITFNIQALAKMSCTQYMQSVYQSNVDELLKLRNKEIINKVVLDGRSYCFRSNESAALLNWFDRLDLFFFLHLKNWNYEKADLVIKNFRESNPEDKEYQDFLSFIMFLDMHDSFYKRSSVFAAEAIKYGIALLKKDPNSRYSHIFKMHYFNLYDSLAYSIMNQAVLLHRNGKYIPAILLYKEIEEKYPLSSYADRARQYLRVIKNVFDMQ